MSHHEHHHTDHDRNNVGQLQKVLALTLGFAGVEYITGWLSQSIALQGDSLHMLSDSASLLIVMFGIWFHKNQWSTKINAWAMIALIVSIYGQAIWHLEQPQVIATGPMLGVAILGLVINIVSYRCLGHGHGDHMHSAQLHVLADLLSSVGVIVAAIVIMFTEWWWIDSVVSVVIATALIPSTYRLLRKKPHEGLF